MRAQSISQRFNAIMWFGQLELIRDPQQVIGIEDFMDNNTLNIVDALCIHINYLYHHRHGHPYHSHIK